MANPVNASRGFFGNLYQSFKDKVTNPLYDKLHPYYGFGPRTDYADIFNPLIDQLDAPGVDREKLKLSLLKLKEEHSKLLDYKTLDYLEKTLIILDQDRPEEAKKLLANFSGALKSMRLKTAGWVSAAYRFSASEPIFYDLQTHLQQITRILTGAGSTQDLPKHIKTAEHLVERLAKEQPRFFYRSSLSSKQQQMLQQSSIAFSAFAFLPDSLQRLCFKPGFQEALGTERLIKATLELTKIVDSAIGSQEAFAAKFNPRDWAAAGKKELINKACDAIAPTQASSKTYIEVLRDTIEAFTTSLDQRLRLYHPRTRWEIVKSLAVLCDRDLPHFSTYFTNFVEDLMSANPEEIFADKARLNEYFETALKSSLEHKGIKIQSTDKLERLIQLCHQHHLSFLTSTEIQNTPPPASINPFEVFASLGSSNFGALSIPFLESFFQSQILENWIASQSLQTQGVARTFAANAKEIITKAKLTKTLESYQLAFKELKEAYQTHHISLNGIPLPAFLDNPELTSSQAEDTVNSIQRMRQMLDASESEHASETLPAEAIPEKIAAKSKEFGQNLQDFLTYKILGGYFLGKKDSTFYHIKKAQLAVVDQNREKYFYHEMKREISHSSLNWFVKKVVLFFFPFIYRFVGSYTKNIVANFHNDLNDRITSLNKHRLLLRATNCISQYNALLKTWAMKPEGGDKDIVIGELMKDKRFLSFGDVSFSQKELYEKLSISITNTYFNLSKGPNGDFGPSHYFLVIRKKINDFVQAPVFNNRRGLFSRLLNKMCLTVKAVFIGIPAHCVTFAISIPVRGWELCMNAIVRNAAKSYLGNFQALHSLFDATKQDIFDNNMYVYPVTSFFADQLEALSKTLASKTFQEDVDCLDQDQVVISDKSRANWKTAFESLFELIKKNEFKTQDSLKDFIEKKEGLSQLKDGVDSFITAKIIDNVIDITFQAYHEMLSEQSLQGSVLMLLENLNESLLAEPHQNADKKKAEHLKHQMAQEKLTKYSEKVLRQVIDRVIDMGLNTVTHQQSTRSTQFIKWIKPKIETLIANYQESIGKICVPNIDEESKSTELEKLHALHNTFQLELETKFESLSASESTVAQELKAKLNPIFTKLQKLLEAGLLALENSQGVLIKLRNDKPHVAACRQAMESLQNSLADLTDDPENAQAKESASNQYIFLSSYLEKIRLLDKDLDLQMPRDFYRNLVQQIETSLTRFKESMKKTIAEENTYKSLKLFNNFCSSANGDTTLEDLVRLKKESIQHGSLYHMLHKTSLKTLHTLYNNTKSKLSKAQISQTHSQLKNQSLRLLDDLMQASSSQEVEDFSRRIQNLDFDTAMQQQSDNLKGLYQTAADTAEPLSTALDQQIEAFDNNLRDNQEKFNTSLGSIDENLNEIEHINQQLEPMQFIDGELETVKGLKSIPHALVYHTIKPKMQGILDLVRNGNFAQFFLNHAVVIPFTTN